MYAVMDAEKVKALREEKDMSVWDLADAAGISLSTAKSVERGEYKAAPATAWKIARVFGLEARDIARPVRRPSERPDLRLVR